MTGLHPQRGTGGGFSLVEAMVGLLIGAIAVVAMLQIYTLSEGQKRTITGGVDAQTNGAIALYQLEREIGQSGYGTSAFNLIGCNVLLRSGVTLAAMAPVTINPAAIPAGDPNTDTLLIAYGNSNGSTEGDGITSQSPPPGNNVYKMQTPTAFAVGDYVIAEPAAPSCGLILTRVTAIAASYVTVATGVPLVVNGRLYNFGSAPTIQAYAVRSGNLTVCDYTVNDCGADANKNNTAVWVPLVGNIVSLRAEYGRDTSPAPPAPMDAIVDVYDQATPPAPPANPCGWVRVSSLRVAVVARSSQYEKRDCNKYPQTPANPNCNVTAAAPVWAGSVVNLVASPSNPTALPIDLTKNPDGTDNPNWQDYRYKLFQTVIPIRNISWLGVQSGC